jgi:hypothetical protein
MGVQKPQSQSAVVVHGLAAQPWSSAVGELGRHAMFAGHA